MFGRNVGSIPVNKFANANVLKSYNAYAGIYVVSALQIRPEGPVRKDSGYGSKFLERPAVRVRCWISKNINKDGCSKHFKEIDRIAALGAQLVHMVKHASDPTLLFQWWNRQLDVS